MRAAVTARVCSGHTAAHSLFRDRSLSPSQIVSENAGPHGPSATAGPASYAAPSVLAETEGSIRRLASQTPANQGEPGLRDSRGPLERSSVDGTGRTLGNGLQKEGGLNRFFQHGLGSSVRRSKEGSLHINCLEMLAVCRALHAFLPDLKGHHVLVRSDSMIVVAYINHQGGLSSRCLFTLVERLLEWAQHNLRSLRATHVPGKLNQGADMLPRERSKHNHSG